MNRTERPYARMLRILFLLTLFASGAVLRAETVRGSLAAPVSAENGEGSFRLFELLPVTAAESPVARSVELVITIPRPFLKYRDSFSISLYGDFSSPLSTDRQQFSGTLLYQKLLPPSGRILLRLPLTDIRSESGPGVLNPGRIFDASSFPLAIQIVPIMKGLPGELMNADIGISARVQLEDAGFLEAAVRLPGEEGAGPGVFPDGTELFLDETAAGAGFLSSKVKLKSGLHTLRVAVPGYAPETRSFTVERGETVSLLFEPEPLESRYTIQAPEGTVVYIDGKQQEYGGGREGVLSPGEHVVLFRFGDYQLSRKIDVRGGKNYNIELFFDIIVEDR